MVYVASSIQLLLHISCHFLQMVKTKVQERIVLWPLISFLLFKYLFEVLDKLFHLAFECCINFDLSFYYSALRAYEIYVLDNLT